MKVIVAGSTGMIGGLVLEYCLESDRIQEVISLVRKPSEIIHSKLKEVTISDFETYDDQQDLFESVHAAFFCIGAYTGQVKDDLFKKITVDFAVNFAKRLKEKSPSATICLLSGQGADRTERSRTAFARYKGMAENQIDALGLQFYTFRPAYIYPVRPREEPNCMYSVSRSLYPIIKLFGKNGSIQSTELARAMVKVGLEGAKKSVLENKDILEYT